MIKNCPKCNIEHNKKGLFCSRSCANSRGPRTDQFKKLVSKKLTGRKGKDNPNKGKYLVERLSRNCLNCDQFFLTTLTESKKYCSNECWKQRSGGYRPRSGRSKSGYYKGIYCGSTYELCWVIYNLDYNIKFSRFEGLLESQDLKYYPDFLLEDGKTIVEIKGFEKQESVNKKTKLAESFGYSVKVLRFDDLEFAFNYVKEKYTDKYHSLYDGYKPNYNYICFYCKNDFSRDKKLKTDVVFCSRQCAGKGHKGRTK
jgi:hypothetical protein